MDLTRHVPFSRSIRNLTTLPTALAGLSTFTVLSALVWCVLDYRAFLALGPGGPPYNVFGWAFMTFLVRPFALSKRAATSVSDYPADGAHESIQALPNRKGERASVGGIAPHRQLSQHPPAEMRKYIDNMFANAVIANGDILEEKLSLYERHNKAIYVRESLLASVSNPKNPTDARPPPTAVIARGEIGHIHPDYSLHLYLSPAEARVVIEKGWGERHRLSKPSNSWVTFKERGNLADTYLMVYGPRTEEECEAVSVMLRASLRFMTGQERGDVPWRVLLEKQ